MIVFELDDKLSPKRSKLLSNGDSSFNVDFVSHKRIQEGCNEIHLIQFKPIECINNNEKIN